MDLRTWIATEHAASATRLRAQVLDVVPPSRWGEALGGASLAWMLWHTALHADFALNAVARGRPTRAEAWLDRLGLDGLAAGTGIGEAEDRAVAGAGAGEGVATYWSEVHAGVSGWLADVDLAELDRVPDAPGALARAGIPDGPYAWLYRMWEGKPVSWLLQWECIGHVQNHVGEAVALRNRMGLSPF